MLLVPGSEPILEGNRPKGGLPPSPFYFSLNRISDPVVLLARRFKADAEGTMLTVAQYFWQTYNYALQFPSLPALEVGNPERNNYLPMEVCRIVEGQRYVRKLNERQITRMLQITCQRPHVRAQQTEAVRPTLEDSCSFVVVALVGSWSQKLGKQQSSFISHGTESSSYLKVGMLYVPGLIEGKLFVPGLTRDSQEVAHHAAVTNYGLSGGCADHPSE